MTVQTAYTKFQREAIAGMIAYDFGTADVTSHIAVSAGVTMGRAVVKGAADRSVQHGNANVIGFSTRSLIGTNAVNTGVNSYGGTEAVPVLREGYIFLKNESAATALVEGGDVYVNTDGQLVASGDAGAAKVIGCRIEKGAAVGEIVTVRVQINKVS